MVVMSVQKLVDSVVLTIIVGGETMVIYNLAFLYDELIQMEESLPRDTVHSINQIIQSR
jgi:hypothetical protein